MNLKKASVIAYVVSLFTPIFFGANDLGYLALLMGWMGVLAMKVFYGLPWIANLLYFSCFLFPKRKIKLKIILNVLAIVLGIFAIGIKESLRIEGNVKVTVGIGFGIWMLSFLLLLMYNVQLLEKSKTIKE